MAKEKGPSISGTVWILLFCVWLSQAASQVITFGYGMMMPSIMAELNVSTDVMGNIGGVASFATVLVTIPISLVAVRFNPRFSVPFTIIAMAIGLFLFGRANSIPMLYVSRLIAACFSQTIGTVLVAIKVRNVPTAKMSQINGIENFVGPAGQTIATLAMAQFLILVGGWRNVYVIISIVMAAAAVIYFFVYGKSNQQAPVGQKADDISAGAALKEAWKNKVVWLTGLAWPGTTIVWIAMFYFWPTYATNSLGITLAQSGMVLSLIPIFSAIASLVAPILANKLGYDKPLIWPWGFILPVVYFAMTRLTNIPLLCVCSAIAGFGAYCFVPMAFTNLYKLGMSSKAVSMATGTVLSFVALGSAIAGSVVGGLTATFGLQTALSISCLTPIWFGVLMLFVPELGRKKMEAFAAAKAAAAEAGG